MTDGSSGPELCRVRGRDRGHAIGELERLPLPCQIEDRGHVIRVKGQGIGVRCQAVSTDHENIIAFVIIPVV